MTTQYIFKKNSFRFEVLINKEDRLMAQKYHLIILKHIIKQILLKSSSLITIYYLRPACSGCPNLYHFAVLMDASISSPLT